MKLALVLTVADTVGVKRTVTAWVAPGRTEVMNTYRACQDARLCMLVRREANVSPMRSVEVDVVPELQTEPDPVLIRIELGQRRSSRALSEERVAPEQGCVLSDLIGCPEIQCDCLDVALPRPPGADGFRGAVHGAEHDKQTSQQGRKRERA